MIRESDIDPLPPTLMARVIRSALRRLDVDPGWSHIESILALGVGGITSCDRARVWRLADGLAIVKDPAPVPGPVEVPASGTLETAPWGLRVRVGPASGSPWTWRSPVPSGVRKLTLRSREPGDRVRTRGGTRKIQDVLVDAKVPRPLRDFVPVVTTDRGPLAVIGFTSTPGSAEVVIDAEPSDPTWSRSAPWCRARA
jgi:tRNA(Ile)-lysidine synthetase-like protein